MGLSLITAALPAHSLPLFVIGGITGGAGGGLAFRAAVVSIATRAPSECRGEVLAAVAAGILLHLPRAPEATALSAKT